MAEVKASPRVWSIIEQMKNRARDNCVVEEYERYKRGVTGFYQRGRVRVFYYPACQRWRWFLPDGPVNQRDVVEFLKRSSDVQDRSDV